MQNPKLSWRTMLVIAAAMGLIGAGRAVCKPCAAEAGLMVGQLATVDR